MKVQRLVLVRCDEGEETQGDTDVEMELVRCKGD